MKLVAMNLVALLGIVALAVGIGYGPTLNRWGADGTTSLWAATAICLAAAGTAALVVAIVVLKWPAHAVQVGLAGTTIRLLLTMFLGLGYQLWADPHLSSFLAWLLILYLLLLVVETLVTVLVLRARLQPPSAEGR